MCRIAWSCIVAAVFAVLGDLFGLGAMGIYFNQSTPNTHYNSFKNLDPFLIEDDWDLRMSLRGLDTAARIFGALAWIVLCIPLLQVTVELSVHGKHLNGLHVAIAVLTVMGAAMEFIANLMYVGATGVMDYIAKDFNLDYWADANDPPADATGLSADKIGWRSFEVTYMCIHGFLLWIDAVEWLFLGVILFLLFLSIQRQPDNHEILSIGFGGFGLFLSFISILDFCTEVLRFKSWMTFTKVAFGISIISRIFLWPIWYIWLGILLKRASAEPFQENNTDMVRFAEPSATASPPATSAVTTTSSNGSTSSAKAEASGSVAPAAKEAVLT